MNSSRFPGKPLASLLERPMVEHVFRRTAMCELLDSVYVATCDEEIRDVIEKIGGRTIMTSFKHERATDRVAEAAEHLMADIILMIQGDEPMITPQMITDALNPMIADSSIKCVNLVQRIADENEFTDLNTIKVVMNTRGKGLYFSRNPIPAVNFATTENLCIYKQVCVIPFRKDFLHKFTRLPPTPLERAESIDMLRAVEHGYQIHLVETETHTHAVDTPDDLMLVESLMNEDPLISLYQEQRFI